MNVFYRHCGEWERLYQIAAELNSREKAQVSIQGAHLAEINQWQHQQLPKQGLQEWWWGKWRWPLQSLSNTWTCKVLSTHLWGPELPSAGFFSLASGKTDGQLLGRATKAVKQFLLALHTPFLFHADWLFAFPSCSFHPYCLTWTSFLIFPFFLSILPPTSTSLQIPSLLFIYAWFLHNKFISSLFPEGKKNNKP